MQVIGLCRFSYAGEGGFQVEHKTLLQPCPYLYAPARMAERFATFETFTLPSIRAQTDPDFAFVIVIGDSFPKHYLDRLIALIADIPQVALQIHAPGSHRQVMKKAINSVRTSSNEHSLQFRLDDDDAVATNFVERLRETAGKLSPILANERHVAIDFRTGYAITGDPRGLMACEINEGFWTPGLAVAFAPHVPQTVMNFSHVKLPQMMPAFSIPGPAMFVRGINDYNDSRQGKGAKPYPFKPITPEIKQDLKSRFGIDPTEATKALSPPS